MPIRPTTTSRASTSRRTRRCCTSSRCCATSDRAQEVPRAGARDQLAARLRGARSTRGSRRAPVETPLEEMPGQRLADRIGLVPILRAGLGMVDAMLELMPTAQVWHLGLFRDERTLRPVEYYNKLPDQATVDLCLILDPMLATGGSATAAIEVLKDWGASAHQAHQPHRRARGRARRCEQPIPTCTSTARRSTGSSTRRATSCPGWATPATASSGPARPRWPVRPPVRAPRCSSASRPAPRSTAPRACPAWCSTRSSGPPASCSPRRQGRERRARRAAARGARHDDGHRRRPCRALDRRGARARRPRAALLTSSTPSRARPTSPSMPQAHRSSSTSGPRPRRSPSSRPSSTCSRTSFSHGRTARSWPGACQWISRLRLRSDRRSRRTAGTPLLVDCSGEHLLAALEAGPDIVKVEPPRGRRGGDRRGWRDRGRGVRRARPRRGAGGGRHRRATAGSRRPTVPAAIDISVPHVDAVNPVGSGDALNAGLSLGLARGDGFEAALALGIAAGSANATTFSAGRRRPGIRRVAAHAGHRRRAGFGRVSERLADRPIGRLTGRGVIVTGASGFAAASARLFASEGARVAIVSRTEERCRALVETIESDGGTASYAVADLADEAQAAECDGRGSRALGRVDGLLNVAGGSGRPFGDGPLHTLTADAWDRTLRAQRTQPRPRDRAGPARDARPGTRR